MKTVLTKFLAISSIGLLMLASCKKDGTLVVSNGGKAGALSANTTTLILDKTKLTDTTKVISFNFTKANYGFSAAVTNVLQIDAAGDNWANPTSFTLGNNVLSQGFSTSVFNALLLKLNLVGGVSAQVNVRVAHTISSNVTPVYSNVLPLTVTPFNLASWVYVPGNYEGWANPGAQEDSLLSATDNGVYTGVINFALTSDQFLIVPVKGSWANKYATTDAAGAAGGPITYTTEYVTGGGNNFYSASKGTVDPAVNITSDLVVLDANKNTLTLTPTLWSIVGDSSPGGWPNGSGPQSDTNMSFSNGTQTWSAIVNLTGGAIKFRLNHDWGTNLGGAGGTLSLNGANISIATAGKYLVTLDPVALTYTVTPSP